MVVQSSVEGKIIAINGPILRVEGLEGSKIRDNGDNWGPEITW